MSAQDPDTGSTLQGRRILVVEDNFLVAGLLKQMLTEWGCEVVGPVASLNEGNTLAGREDLHGAILDINIRGGNSAPIATALRQRGTPFIFITGYGSPRMLPTSLADVTRLNKPINPAQLQTTLQKALVASG